jgi:hypothetical protein
LGKDGRGGGYEAFRWHGTSFSRRACSAAAES